jgi:hypothetical protein
MPERIQRKRTRGWRMPEGAVYVGRGSRFGNPFRVTNGKCDHPDCSPQAHPPITRAKAVAAYRLWLHGMLQREPAFTDVLSGKDLACWCPLDQPCHADVLLELANG